jgi:hypothetical protein
MFPEGFVERQLTKYTREGDWVLDPFSGRGTTLLQALLMKRNAIAVDVNPVAFCLSGAKAWVPTKPSIRRRLALLGDEYIDCQTEFARERAALPEFFRRAYHHETLNQLLFLRSRLNWQGKPVDRFIAAILLGILHGESNRSDRYLSNQMPRTISPKPAYSVRWWKERRLWPRKRNVFGNLLSEVEYRLRGDRPEIRGMVALTDARLASIKFAHIRQRVAAIVTSPPYFDVTSAEEDQWLRLWFLGNASHPTYRQVSPDDRYEVSEKYWQFLSEVWVGLAPLLLPGAVLVCRIGGKGLTTRDITRGLVDSLKSAFPDAQLIGRPRKSEVRNRQTRAFRPGTTGYRFEVDYAFRLS